MVLEPLVVRLRMKENFSMEEIHSLIILYLVSMYWACWHLFENKNNDITETILMTYVHQNILDSD